MVVAECGHGKTLISLGAIHVRSNGNPFTALAMVPPHIVEKWAREAFVNLPGVRVFLIDDLRNGGDENKAHGVNEVRLKQARIVREGFHTTLNELRLRKEWSSSRKRWLSLCGRPSLLSSDVNWQSWVISGGMLTAYPVQGHTRVCGEFRYGKTRDRGQRPTDCRRIREGQNCRDRRDQGREVLCFVPSGTPMDITVDTILFLAANPSFATDTIARQS